MARRWLEKLNHLPVRTRLTALFALVSIIPVLTIGYVSLQVSSQNLLNNGVRESLNRLAFIDYRTVEFMREKHKETLIRAFNPSVRALFDENHQSDNPTLMEDQATRAVISLYNSQEATSVSFLGIDGTALIYGRASSSAIEKEHYPELGQFDRTDFKLFDAWNHVTNESGEAVIPYERLVLALSDNHPTGRLILNIKERIFSDLYNEYESALDSEFFIVNDRMIIQSCSDKALLGFNAYDTLGIDLSSLPPPSGHVRVGSNIVSYMKNEPRGLYFLERTAANRYTEGFWPIVQMLVVVMVISAVICVLLGSLLSATFTKPLYRLIDRVAVFDKPRPNRAHTMTKNEIAILNDQYDSILERLEITISEYHEEQQKKKEAQIRALEFQINPHFLYNTLSTIVWLIEADERKSAIRVTKELSEFFRISISKGRQFIALREEMRHVELYINIQMTRYEDCITISYDLSDAAMDVYVPKLILQPLVENSIMHAMQTSKDKTCAIGITAHMEGSDVIIQVRDNGDAITMETINSMNQFLRVREQSPFNRDYGIGISNVHDRIVMNFGEPYGLSYSRENGETVATLRIPATGKEKPYV